MPFKPLLASYGGGHVQIISALAKAMIARGDKPQIIGFTTAYSELCKENLHALTVSSLLDEAEDSEWLALADKFTSGVSHPKVSAEDTRAYFAIGLKDLSAKTSKAEAIELVKQKGRQAFEPVETMRRYLRKTKLDFVVTTTSPRFELALLKAARLEGIPHLAIGDLFLVKESEYMADPLYAEHIAVLSDAVADNLVRRGVPQTSLHVTGNPAFDNLAVIMQDTDRRHSLRHWLGMTNKRVILFPAPSAKISAIGRPFADIMKIVRQLEAFCADNTDYAFIIRQHPNAPLTLPELQHGYLDDGSFMTAEEAILTADIICVESSTMGLQAALTGKPVFTINFADYVLYPQFGLARAVDTLDEALFLIQSDCLPISVNSENKELGKATQRVLAFIDEIRANSESA